MPTYSRLTREQRYTIEVMNLRILEEAAAEFADAISPLRKIPGILDRPQHPRVNLASSRRVCELRMNRSSSRWLWRPAAV